MATKPEPTAKSSSAQEKDALQRFSDRYSIERNDALLAMERSVIGGDWGANGFTTLTQADDLIVKLELERGDLLLDVGSGRGWPGLYISQQTGCEAVLSDLPVEGLTSARQRARDDELPLIGGVVCSAKHLPFRAATFDAVVHTDVMC